MGCFVATSRAAFHGGVDSPINGYSQSIVPCQPELCFALRVVGAITRHSLNQSGLWCDSAQWQTKIYCTCSHMYSTGPYKMQLHFMYVSFFSTKRRRFHQQPHQSYHMKRCTTKTHTSSRRRRKCQGLLQYCCRERGTPLVVGYRCRNSR